MSTLEKSRNIVHALKSELKRAKKEAEYWELMATTDDLTGLHNRRMIYNIDECLNERREKSKSGEVTLLFIDLDDFGKINKKYGDDMGDEALRVLGRTIRKNIRQEDIAIRKGGDEFVIILIGSTMEAASDTVVKRLQLMLDGELSIPLPDKSRLPIRGSIGVFEYDRNISPFDNLKQADELMREQKTARKAAIAGLNLQPVPLPSAQQL
jgi:diguanylate cyclase (GGDEF)-like protein